INMGCQPVAASTKQLRRADGGGRKREGATGSLATLASGRGASHPRSFHHGSQLPTMSRGEPQVAREQTDYTVASTASGIISPGGSSKGRLRLPAHKLSYPDRMPRASTDSLHSCPERDTF